ncbi:MAG: serine/threonine protein phosphatase [Rhodobacteraceae bacterium]|nr:serine/threonine protein phosphatase [Paracoccaceae bacterium]
MMRKYWSIFGGTPPRIVDMERHEGVAYVIGDIHGSLNLLKGLERKILADAKGQNEQSLLICIGDMIDRGPDSFSVLEHVMAPPPEGFQRICLMGNHEEMMLKFLKSPGKAQVWLDFGGYETLCSYGLLAREIQLAQGNARKMKLLLDRVIPRKHSAFLRALPHGIQLKDFVIAHAGGNPARPFGRQSVQDLLWGAHTFLEATVRGDKPIVCGHYFVDAPRYAAEKIAIDTGAYKTGVLTAVKLGPGQTVEFISYSEPESGAE